MNAIERLRVDHLDSWHIDTDECTSSCVVCASLAAVEALYQAAKLVAEIEERPTYVGWFRDHKAAAEALAAAVRRVGGEA